MLYFICRGIVWFFFRLIFRIEVKGRENIPKDDGALICPNHYHWADPLLIAIVTPRKINFMAKYELFEIPLLRWILNGVGTYPVKRGEADLNASKITLRLLKDKQLVGMFPEGTRIKEGVHGNFGKANSGVAVFSVKTKKPVIPVLITGDYYPFKKMRVVFGEPVELHRFKEGKLTSNDYDELSQIIMGKISELRGDDK